MDIKGRRIAVAVTGGIAAYKAADLTSRLRKEGAEVRVAMTRSAKKFVGPLTFEAISGHPVYRKVFDQPNAYRMEHIEWARWADGLVVAPATADFIARMAQGLADDAPLTLYLAFAGPVWIAPAMNTTMWEHPATQANVEILRGRGVEVIGPGSGPLACGEVGDGRMAEPEEIVRILAEGLEASLGGSPRSRDERDAGDRPRPLAGERVLITAGPTREALDPIRFISNRSTGRMGSALAAAAMRLGAQVTLIHGPLAAPIPEGAESVPAEDARAMLRSVQERLAGCKVAIFAAAVSNYRAASTSEHKIKGGDRLQLDLVRTPDIAAWAGNHRNGNGQIVVGFAAESENLIEAAKKKLEEKNLDLVFANPIGVAGVGFEADSNQVTMIGRDGGQADSGRMKKDRIADWIWERILERMGGGSSSV